MKRLLAIPVLVWATVASPIPGDGETGLSDKELAKKDSIWFARNPASKPMWETLEERRRRESEPQNPAKAKVRTPPPPGPVRQSAEFEPMEGVLIRWALGLPVSCVKEMAEDVMIYCLVTAENETSARTGFIDGGVNMDNVVFVNGRTDSYWTRDYGPWWVFDGNGEPGIVDFTYNRDRPNDNNVPGLIGQEFGIPVYEMPLRLTGGNHMADGYGIAASCDLVWNENPQYTRGQIDSLYRVYLGIDRFIVTEDINTDYIHHVDCFAKFLSPEVILIKQLPSSHENYDRAERVAAVYAAAVNSWGRPYTVVRIPTPNDEPYTNSLILNNKIFVPILRSETDTRDAAALAVYRQAMPGYEVHPVRHSWESTDALHCRTRGIADRGMLRISHLPLAQAGTAGDYPIRATIVAHSGEEIIPDSVLLYWKTGDDPSFTAIVMDMITASEYGEYIPAQSEGTTVHYYLHAADNSGRSENHPYIGAAQAHAFRVTGRVFNLKQGTEMHPLLVDRYSCSAGVFRFWVSGNLGHKGMKAMVYTAQGRMVQAWTVPRGSETFFWDTRQDNNGRRASGYYFLQFVKGDQKTTLPLVVR
ncbi:MAG: agmatine deiminase family protein [Chitinispirillaceae bacterium]|nr:agmatine deiminase family protein [Chitinispirillaceae bacterium]